MIEKRPQMFVFSLLVLLLGVSFLATPILWLKIRAVDEQLSDVDKRNQAMRTYQEQLETYEGRSLTLAEQKERTKIASALSQIQSQPQTKRRSLKDTKSRLDLAFQLASTTLILSLSSLLAYKAYTQLITDSDNLREIEKSAEKTEMGQDSSYLLRAEIAKNYSMSMAQARNSFWIGVIAMTSGLVVVLLSILLYTKNFTLPSAGLSAFSTLSGILAQFYGGAYLNLYKKSLAQVNFSFLQLAAINRTILAIEACDKIQDATLRDDSRKEIALALIMGAQNHKVAE